VAVLKAVNHVPNYIKYKKVYCTDYVVIENWFIGNANGKTPVPKHKPVF
jgi:hypothetical protein